MLDNIKTEYEELFELTKRACKILENDLDSLISDAEVAYLTLHFGAFMPTQKSNKHARNENERMDGHGRTGRAARSDRMQ